MKKEVNFSESRQSLWRSQVQPQPGQKEPGIREGSGVCMNTLAWARKAGVAPFTVESPAPSAQ